LFFFFSFFFFFFEVHLPLWSMRARPFRTRRNVFTAPTSSAEVGDLPRVLLQSIADYLSYTARRVVSRQGDTGRTLIKLYDARCTRACALTNKALVRSFYLGEAPSTADAFGFVSEPFAEAARRCAPRCLAVAARALAYCFRTWSWKEKEDFGDPVEIDPGLTWRLSLDAQRQRAFNVSHVDLVLEHASVVRLYLRALQPPLSLANPLGRLLAEYHLTPHVEWEPGVRVLGGGMHLDLLSSAAALCLFLFADDKLEWVGMRKLPANRDAWNKALGKILGPHTQIFNRG